MAHLLTTALGDHHNTSFFELSRPHSTRTTHHTHDTNWPYSLVRHPLYVHACAPPPTRRTNKVLAENAREFQVRLLLVRRGFLRAATHACQVAPAHCAGPSAGSPRANRCMSECDACCSPANPTLAGAAMCGAAASWHLVVGGVKAHCRAAWRLCTSHSTLMISSLFRSTPRWHTLLTTTARTRCDVLAGQARQWDDHG